MIEPETINPSEQGESRTKRVLRGASAQWMLGLLSFLESTILPIILDPFLVMITLARRESWKRYSFIAAATSVIGGAAGYLLGVLFYDFIGERLVALYHLEQAFQTTTELFNGSVFWVTLVGAITPIPYKIFALAGGVLHVNFLLFIAASILGRFARFFLVGFITYRFGEHALRLFSRRFNYVMIVLVLVVIAYITNAFF